MKIWLIEISDFVPQIDGNNRLYRVGMLAKALVANNHQVLWWSSTFNHQLRRQRFNVSTTINLQENYRLRLLYGPGYNKSISLRRISHNRIIANQFAGEANNIKSGELPDLIYACLPTLEVSEQAVIFGNTHEIPVVVDIRDKWPEIYLSPLPILFRPLIRFALRKEFKRAHTILKNSDAITGVSETNLEWGLSVARRKQRPNDKWFPLGFPEYTDNEVFQIRKEQLCNKWGIKKHACVVTFVGSFSPTCNFKSVIEVAQTFSKQGDERIQFVFVGDGAQTTLVQKASKRLNNILMTGWRSKPEVDEILMLSSIGLTPYTSKAPQTLPNKPFEYMAAGLPILSSLKGELKELLEQEEIGFYYNSNDHYSLREKILWFLSHSQERERMGQKAKSLFKKKYSSDIIYANMVEYLTDIASRNAE
jgi:glycosyltransferase involved in cell wall biosynthesis